MPDVLAYILAAGLAASALLLISCWLPNGKAFRQDMSEGEMIPQRWFSWGDIKPWRGSYPIRKYWQLRLPSWQYMPRPWFMTDSQQCYWHQLTLFWVEGRSPRFGWVEVWE